MIGAEPLASLEPHPQQQEGDAGDRLKGDAVPGRGEPDSLQDFASPHEILGPVSAHAQERDRSRALVDLAGADGKHAADAQGARHSRPPPGPQESKARSLERTQLERLGGHPIAPSLGLGPGPANPTIHAVVEGAILEHDPVVLGGEGGDPPFRRLGVYPGQPSS